MAITDSPIYNGISNPAETNIADLSIVLNNIKIILLNGFTVAAILATIISGIMYMTALGESKKQTDAKRYLGYSLLAVAATVGANLLITFAQFVATKI